MSTLASRMQIVSGHVTPDLSELVTQSGVTITITIDHSVDPAELRIVEEEVWPFPTETLLVRPVDDGTVTLTELAQILDRLGYPVDYQELR